MRERIQRVLSLREGGHTKRCHTIPTIGDNKVSEHTWHMLVLLHIFCPDARPGLIWSIVFHDVPERWTGDTPADAKYGIAPELGAMLKKVEARVESELGIGFGLEAEEQALLKSLDMLEFYLYCHDQINMGNRHMIRALENAKSVLLSSDWIHEPVREFTRAFEWERTGDITPLTIREVVR